MWSQSRSFRVFTGTVGAQSATDTREGLGARLGLEDTDPQAQRWRAGCYRAGEYTPVSSAWAKIRPSMASKTWAMVASAGRSRTVSRA